MKEDLSFFETRGFSMWPFLKEGEKLIIKKTKAQDLRIGDIILYRLDSQLVCHRLIRKDSEVRKGYLIYTRGDNGGKLEGPVASEAILGMAIAVIKNNRIISLSGWRRVFLNPLIALIAPFVKWAVKVIKPLIK